MKVVDKLVTILSFKIDDTALGKYAAKARKAAKAAGDRLGRASSFGGRALSRLSEASSFATNNLGLLTGVVGLLTFGVGTALVGGVSGAINMLSRLGNMMTRFTGQVFKTNAEFERLRALLVNVTGSDAIADKFLARFEKFAKDTPFRLNSITDLFLNIKGLGADLDKGGADGLTAIGDLAASAGVDLHTFTEIFKSAAQGNAAMVDKLAKAGGIRAITEKNKLRLFGPGDKKGTLVDPKDTQALLDFFIAAGKAKGIEGGMRKLSQTLPGLLSTFQDNIAAFMRQVGKGGFNKAVKELFGVLNLGAGQADGFGRAIGRLMGKVISFGTKTLTALKFDKIMATVEVFFNKLGLGFDGLAGADGPTKLARAIELPFKVLDSLMLMLEGKGADSLLGKFFAQFEKGEGPLSIAAESFTRILGLLGEMDGGGDAGMLRLFEQTGGNLIAILTLGLEVLLRYGPIIAVVVSAWVTGMSEIGRWVLQVSIWIQEKWGALKAVTDGWSNATSSGVNAVSAALGGLTNTFDTWGTSATTRIEQVVTLLSNLKAKLSDAASSLTSLEIPGLGKTVGDAVSFFTGGGDGGLGAAANNRASTGAPVAGNNSTTTTTTSTSHSVNVGVINVKSADEVGGAVGGLSASGAGVG